VIQGWFGSGDPASGFEGMRGPEGAPPGRPTRGPLIRWYIRCRASVGTFAFWPIRLRI